MKKQNKGITLIALIITIVVMLILVGIVVSTTINSNLINKVKRAKGEWERAEGEDSNIAGVTIDGKYYGSLQDYVTQLGSVSAYGVDSIIDDGLIYRKTSDTEVAVVGILDKSAVKANIKSTIDFEGKRYTVTSIGSNAFYGCSNLISVTIPEGVISIGLCAFYGCSNLISITIPEGVTSIGSMAFAFCSGLTSLTIPDSVINIDMGAFGYCSNLTSITILGKVANIEVYYTFYNCSNLTSITIAEINENYSSHDGVLYNKDKTSLLLCPAGKTGNLEIPASVTSIGSLSNCTNLTSITVAEGNANYSSEDGVLYNKEKTELIVCPAGKNGSLQISEGVTSIYSSAFSGCSSLTSITVAEGNANYSSEDGVVYNKDKTELIVCPAGKTGNLEIAEGVTSIGYNVFNGCSGITSIKIPASVSYLDSLTFDNCTNLTSITVAEGNANYSSEDGVLYNKEKTELIVCLPGKTGTLEIAEGVTSIYSSTFYGCSGLTSIKIPASVTFVDSWSFGNCTNLTSITVAEGNANYSSEDGVLYNKGKTELIVCPAGKTGTVEIPDSVTNISYGAFNSCKSLTSISVKDADQKQLVVMSMYGVDNGIIIQRDLQT